MALPAIAALKNEILTDPVALGLKTLVAVAEGGTSGSGTQDASLAALLNAIGIGTTFLVFRNDVLIKDLAGAIAAADFAAMTALQIAQLQLLFAGTTTLDASSANLRTILNNMVASASAGTKTAVAALAQRQGSRAEVLWGTGTIITQAQISLALRGF